jgi:5-methylcytosine-specific restriction endonuclease McrA
MSDPVMTPWLDKEGLAEHFACSTRSIEMAQAEGMPHARIFGRPKFQVPEVEAWLERTGAALTQEPWRDTLRRDPCAYCGRPSDHIDHIIPRAHGGPDRWTNYTAACWRNHSKGAHPMLRWLATR